MRLHRYYLSIPLDAVATLLQLRGVDATLYSHVGVGTWGREEGTTIEVGTETIEEQIRLESAVSELLAKHGESCAFRVDMPIDGRLWYGTGEREKGKVVA